MIPEARRFLFFLLILLLLSGTLSADLYARAAAEIQEPLTVAAIPFRISESIYSSPRAFREAVNTALDAVEAQAAEEGLSVNLAVFPEYTSAFLALSYLKPGTEGQTRAGTEALPKREEIIEALKAAYPEVLRIWEGISRERTYSILAGTTLYADEQGGIRNRALLFSGGTEGTSRPGGSGGGAPGPGGSGGSGGAPDSAGAGRHGVSAPGPGGSGGSALCYLQDKVFPGAPEERILHLQTGRIADAHSFNIDGYTIVMTICRDTYNSEWETALPPAHLWIDIKANELPYTPAYYAEALAARLPNSPTNRGLVVSLQGQMMGYSFTGPCQYLSNEEILSEILPDNASADTPAEALIVQVPKLPGNALKSFLDNRTR